MSKKFTGTYEINDGYAGGARPQRFTIAIGEVDDDLTDDELIELYNTWAEEEFRKNIGISVSGEEEFVAWVREQQAEEVEP